MSVVASTASGIFDSVLKQSGPLLHTVLGQLHAGAKVEAKVTFDLPGPFDPVISVSAVIAFDAGALKIKELHIIPAVA